MHAFTVDVEDWFHILDCPQSPAPEAYTQFESRVERNTERVLTILEEKGVKGTFFILGWVADQYPRLVGRIASAGHEIAVHGFDHVLASDLSDRELEIDIRRAVEAVSDAAGVQPMGYRSPGGSLLLKHRWVFELLLELGIQFDSSIYPRPGGLAEAEGFPLRPYIIHQRGERALWEYPSTIRKALGLTWAFAEGGYLRLLPLPLVRRWFRKSEWASLNVSVCVHPREFDPGQPRLPLNPLKQWKTQVGLKGLEAKIHALLSEFQFCPMGEILRSLTPSSTDQSPVVRTTVQ